MRTLIINGSPRKNGDTVTLLNVLKSVLKGEIIEISTFRDKISPCADCRKCWETGVCSIKDKMDIIYNDDFENVIVASPIYISGLPSHLMSLAERFQVYYGSKKILKTQREVQSKNGGFILIGGGDGKPDRAISQGKNILKGMNATIDAGEIILYQNTNVAPAVDDSVTVEKVKELAMRLNNFKN